MNFYVENSFSKEYKYACVSALRRLSLKPADLLRLIADLLVKGQNPPPGPQSLNTIPRKTHRTRLYNKIVELCPFLVP